MSTKTLSNISEEATEQTNVTGQMTPILVIQPTNGMMLEFLGKVARGDELGIPIYGGLLDAVGDPLPDDTEMVLRYDAPRLDEPRSVSVPKDNITNYNIHSLQDQQDDERVDAVKHRLKGKAVRVRDIDELQVAINSSVQIDWSQPGTRLQFDENAVREIPDPNA